jgi:hypothetical protein
MSEAVDNAIIQELHNQYPMALSPLAAQMVRMGLAKQRERLAGDALSQQSSPRAHLDEWHAFRKFYNTACSTSGRAQEVSRL